MRTRFLKILLQKGRHPLAILYLLFAIFPHVAAITHTHAGGESAHTHAFLNARDNNLDRQTLENLGNVAGTKAISLPPEAPLENVSPGLVSVERGTQGFRSTLLRHTHFQEDPNLLALGILVAIMLTLMALQKSPAFRSPFVPVLPQFSPSARGPPGFFSSVK